MLPSNQSVRNASPYTGPATDRAACILLDWCSEVPNYPSSFAEEFCSLEIVDSFKQAGFTAANLLKLRNLTEISSELRPVLNPFNIPELIERSFHAEDLIVFLEALYKCQNTAALQFEVHTLYSDLSGKLMRIPEIVDMRNSAGEFLLVGSSADCVFSKAAKLADQVGTAAKIQAFLKYKDSKGEPLFSSLYELRIFIVNGGSRKKLNQLLELKFEDQQQMFDSGYDLCYFASSVLGSKSRFDNFQQIIKLVSDSKDSIFQYAEDISDFIAAGGTLQLLKKFSVIQSSYRNAKLTGYEIAMLQEAGVDPDRLDSAVTTLQNAFKHKLSLPSAVFVNDGRPKCSILISTADTKSIMQSTRVFADDSQPFYSSLAKYYDLQIVPIVSTDQLRKELDNAAMLNCEAVIIAGHGQPGSIAISKDLSRYNIGRGAASIKSSDTDLLSAFIGFKVSMTVFLDSCLTAHGGFGADNLITALCSYTKARVIACRDSFPAKEVMIKSFSPFDVSVVRGLKDLAVRNFYSEECLMFDSSRYRSGRRIDLKNSLTIDQKDPRRSKLKELTKEVSLNSYPMFYADDLKKLFTSSEYQMEDVIFNQKHDPWLYYNSSPAQFVFGELLNETWCPAYGLCDALSGLLANFQAFLVDKNFHPVSEPLSGDVVVYLGKDKYSGSDYEVKHYGLMQSDGNVISRPSLFPVTKHPLDIVSSKFGDRVMFYRKIQQIN